MSLHPTRSIGEVVTKAMASLGGKATIRDVVEQVRATATALEWQVWSERSISAAVRSSLRATNKSGNLPEFYAVAGEYKELTLFSVEDYEAKGRALAKLSVQNGAKVYALADACLIAHGRTFDAEKIIKDAAA